MFENSYLNLRTGPLWSFVFLCVFNMFITAIHGGAMFVVSGYLVSELVEEEHLVIVIESYLVTVYGRFDHFCFDGTKAMSRFSSSLSFCAVS